MTAAEPRAYFAGTVAANPVVVIRGALSQTGDLLPWSNSTGTKLGAIAPDGMVDLGNVAGKAPLGGSVVDGDKIALLGRAQGVTVNNYGPMVYLGWNDHFQVGVIATAAWHTDTDYALHQQVRPTTPNGHLYTCTVPGRSSASTEPTWPTNQGDTVVDNTATWTCEYADAGQYAAPQHRLSGDGTAWFSKDAGSTSAPRVRIGDYNTGLASGTSQPTSGLYCYGSEYSDAGAGQGGYSGGRVYVRGQVSGRDYGMIGSTGATLTTWKPGAVALQVKNADATPTANLQNWVATSTTVASMNAAGTLNAAGLTVGGTAVLLTGAAAGGDLTGSTYPNPTIAAGAVTAGKVGFTLGGTNLAPNASFEDTSLPGLARLGSQTAYATDATTAVDGVACVKITRNTTGNLGFYLPRVPANAGWTYTMTVYAKRGTGATNLGLGIDWYTALSGGSLISSSTAYPNATTDWTRYQLTAVAPATTLAARINLFSQGGSTTDELYLDAVQFEAGDVPTAFGPKPADFAGISLVVVGAADVTFPATFSATQTTGNISCVSVTTSATPSATSSPNLKGLVGSLSINAGTGIAITSSEASAINGAMTYTGAGTVASGYSFESSVSLGSSVAVTGHIGFYAQPPGRTGTGTIGTSYGFYSAAQKVGFVTTGYGIYQAGANDVNRFSGSVGIGMAATGNAGDLSVNGDVVIGGQLSARYNDSVGDHLIVYSDYMGLGVQASRMVAYVSQATAFSVRGASPIWVALTAFTLGRRVRPTAANANGYGYVCTKAGTTDANEPTWPTGVGDTVDDGGVTWTRGAMYSGWPSYGDGSDAVALYPDGHVLARQYQDLHTTTYTNKTSAFDITAGSSTANAVTAGVLYLTKLLTPTLATTMTYLVSFITQAAAGTVTNCYMGLYGSDGTLLGATADSSTAWKTAGRQRSAIATGAITVLDSAGFVWLGILCGAASTTLPAFLQTTSNSYSAMNMGITAATTARFATYGTGQTALPSPLTLDTAAGHFVTTGAGPCHWAATQ